MISWIVHLPASVVMLLVVLLPRLEASAFVGFVFPGEIAVLLGGVLAQQGSLPLWAVIVGAAAGAIIGDSLGYEIGRHYGPALLTRLPARVVKPDRVAKSSAFLHHHRGKAIFLGRFTAALRVMVPGMAGIARLPYRSFLMWNMAGGVVWAAETAIVGYLAGSSYRAAEHLLSLIGLGVLLLIVSGFTLSHFRHRPAVRTVILARFDPTRWTGRPLTLLAVAFVAVAFALAGWVFGGLWQDVRDGDGLAAADPRLQADALALRQFAWLTPLARAVTRLGGTP